MTRIGIFNLPRNRDELVVGRWYWGLSVGRTQYRMMEMGWKVFDFWVAKMREIPGDGATFKLDFQVKFAFWLPFDRA